MAVNPIARAAAKLWYVKILNDVAAVPVPHDARRITSDDPDADQVLLVGNGPTHGWGTVTHELALTGQLSRALTRRTGRAADVEYVGDEAMNLAAVLPWLGDVSLGAFDLVVLVLSTSDAVRLTGPEEYRADMERLLESVTTRIRPEARVVVAGIPPVRSFPKYTGLFASVGQRHADVLNRLVREMVGRYDGVEFLELDAPQAEPGRPFGSPARYASWAERFGDVSATALDEVRRIAGPARPAPSSPAPVWGWAPGKHIIDQAAAGGWDELESLVAEAKQEFGMDLAMISLIDGGRQYYAATTGKQAATESVPSGLTHCETTMRGDGPLVVKNSFKDERFKDSPFIDLLHLQYYAGMPLKNAEGENVGTFCLMSVLPKGRSVPEAQLRTFAARAEQELQRIAAEGEEAPNRSVADEVPQV